MTTTTGSTTSVEGDTTTTTVHPAIWDVPGSGMAWCDCGTDHDLRRQDVVDLYLAGGYRRGRVPHRDVVRASQVFWGYDWVCRFFHMKVEDAAVAISGAVRRSYPLDDAIDITGLFIQTWQGCPEQSCAMVDADS